MKNTLSCVLFCLVSLLVLAPPSHAQADYTANKASRIEVGAGYLFLKPDYVDTNIQGVSIWGDYDFLKYVGVEVSANLGNIITPSDINENSYQVGPRFLYHHRKFTGYGKILFGRATISNTDFNTSSSYNIYSFGGGLEYKIKRRINIRVIDFDYQQWPNFEPHTLSPIAFSFGASYIIR